MDWPRGKHTYVLLFVCGLVAYGLVAGNRVFQQSPDPHFVYQADAWLHGRLDVNPPPKKGDDWAILERVELHDGTIVAGRRMITRPNFLIAGGGEIPRSRIRRSLGRRYFVSFPPAPALAMLPSALLSGRRGNDVIPTLLAAALVLPLAFSTLRRLASAGLSSRSPTDDLWLVATFAFGSVFFFAAVQGRVWFTAHVFGALLLWGYLRASIEAEWPVIAGLCLAMAALSRVPLAFAFPLFLFEAWRVSKGSYKDFIKRAAIFATPVVVLAILAATNNWLRWDDPLEFGHRFLNVRQQHNIETHGLFDLSYLKRNLVVAFGLLPRLGSESPYLQISGHGIALWLCSPILVLALWPRKHTHLHAPLWTTLFAIALPALFYQNSGWFQFGYRFAIDYLPILVLLLAAGPLRLGRMAKALIIFGVVVNLFGAVTFGRYHHFYRTNAATYQDLHPQ